MNKTFPCPSCGQQIEISEALVHQFEADAEKIASEKSKKELELQKERLIKEFSEKQSLEITDLQKQISEQKLKNEEFVERELELRKKTRELEEKGKELMLQNERKLDEERKKIAEDAIKAEEEKHHLKDLEKEKVIDDLKKALEDAQRKANQGSQQTQGEAFELEFEEILRKEFPNDIVQEVAKGVRGGDVVQEVVDRNGVSVGKVLWELKNTKTWSEGWIDKLKTDLRTIKADDAVLITEVLPNDMKSSGAFRNGVWVTQRGSVVAIASVLRAKLIQLHYAKQSVKGKNEKTEILHAYLSGIEFKHRVESIIDAWGAMQDDIEKEKRYFAGKWARDDKNIRLVIDNTIGMRGDLEGIMGNNFLEIKGLDALAITDGMEDSD